MASLSAMVPELRARLDCLNLNVIDEDLAVTNSFTIYQAENRQWRSFPVPRVRKIDSTGLEMLLVPVTNYSIDAANGKVTLVVAALSTDVIRADYSFDVFTDAQLSDLLVQSAREVNNLVHRFIDTTDVDPAYKEAILKRAFSNGFKCLMEPMFNFYSASVGGRTVDKTMLVDSVKKIIDENESFLVQDINSLRNYNQTNRFE